MAKTHMDRDQVSQWFMGLQDRICAGLEDLDGSTFTEDKWERSGGGGGRSRVIMGDLIEKGGVNFSAVHGPLPSKISTALGIDETNFFATGVSIVLHPRNPMMPIIHMNVRFFDTDAGPTWFGGGIDVTPHYVVEDDARYFHNHLKDVCDRHDSDYYPRFKQWADDYFFIKHRDETRGIGGIFYDRLSHDDTHTMDDRWAYTQDVGDAFLPIYRELVGRNADRPFTPDHRDWQLVRRGRYVEFNLVWDRGTKFGLDTNGRTESILMSMPPDARWIYSHEPEEGSAEAHTLSLLKKGIDWV